MATEVSICANALRRLGDDPITSLTDDTERARLCNAFYSDARDAVLRSHPWNFAITRATLAQLSDTPAYGFNYQYALPTDPFCLRVLEMEYKDYIFKVENVATHGRVLLTDEGTAKILYIARITDTTLFDAMFVDTLTAKLAVDLAYPVTNSMQVQTNMQKLYQLKLSEARSIDGQEGFIDDLVSNTFTDFRK
jgi:plasmid maintenance system antidote protein VapI|tara:strand:+ start:270 stop:848 length:579 start_codon:yes stop_codon:yes gene_type:complete